MPVFAIIAARRFQAIIGERGISVLIHLSERNNRRQLSSQTSHQPSIRAAEMPRVVMRWQDLAPSLSAHFASS